MSPNPIAPEPEPLARVQDEHRPRGPERHVEDQDREHQRPDGRVVPHPAQALGDVVADVGVVVLPARCGGNEMREISSGAGADEHGVGGERQRLPDREQQRAERRPDQLVHRDEPGLDAGVGQRQVVAVDEHRHERARRVVRERLGGAQQEHRDQDDPDRRDVGEARPPRAARRSRCGRSRP